MFKRKPAYSTEELTLYITRLETLDRLMEKAKRNWLGTPKEASEKEFLRAKSVYDGYTNTLLVAQTTYQRMLDKVAK